jgi:hypothetical protein
MTPPVAGFQFHRRQHRGGRIARQCIYVCDQACCGWGASALAEQRQARSTRLTGRRSTDACLSTINCAGLVPCPPSPLPGDAQATTAAPPCPAASPRHLASHPPGLELKAQHLEVRWSTPSATNGPRVIPGTRCESWSWKWWPGTDRFAKRIRTAQLPEGRGSAHANPSQSNHQHTDLGFCDRSPTYRSVRPRSARLIQ